MTHGVTIQGHTAHAGGSTHRPIPAATHSGRDIHADLERVHGRVSPIVLRDPTPDAVAPETRRAQADVKRYTAPDIDGDTAADTDEDIPSPETATPQVSAAALADMSTDIVGDELPAHVMEWARLLNDTARSSDPLIAGARHAVLAALNVLAGPAGVRT